MHWVSANPEEDAPEVFDIEPQSTIGPDGKNLWELHDTCKEMFDELYAAPDHAFFYWRKQTIELLKDIFAMHGLDTHLVNAVVLRLPALTINGEEQLIDLCFHNLRDATHVGQSIDMDRFELITQAMSNDDWPTEAYSFIMDCIHA